MKYIDSLIEDCKKAKNAKPKRSFVVGDLAELDGINNAVYTIEDLSGNPNKTFADFVAYKKRDERKCPKANAPSKTMYVGSSTTGIRKRIEQHQGDGHAAAIAYWLLQQTIIAAQGDSSVLRSALGSDWKGKLSPVLYLLAILLTLVAAWSAQLVFVFVAILWLVPDRRIERAIRHDA
ncbi:MAG: hypothetical protein R3E64_09600 [Halioglobus sp.]